MNKRFVIAFTLITSLLYSCGSTSKIDSYKKVGTPSSKNNSSPNYRSSNLKFSTKEVDSLLKTAKSYLGVPYKYGGNNQSGFDCSGLVVVSFDKLGLKLPRVSSQQANSGKEIKINDVRKGDLLFFNTSGNSISHVGIIDEIDHSGEIKFIHSSTSKGVIISSLDENYWKLRFVKAVRVL